MCSIVTQLFSMKTVFHQAYKNGSMFCRLTRNATHSLAVNQRQLSNFYDFRSYNRLENFNIAYRCGCIFGISPIPDSLEHALSTFSTFIRRVHFIHNGLRSVLKLKRIFSRWPTTEQEVSQTHTLLTRIPKSLFTKM